MKVCVIGSGYVGLVVGTCLADSGNTVHCVDLDEEKIARLNQGFLPIYEPGLEELVRRNMKEGRLKFATDVRQAIHCSQLIFIAVGTPPKEDGSADLQQVLSVAEGIGQAIEQAIEESDGTEKLVVIKSTVPVGTNEKVKERIASITKKPFYVVSNPEFLKEGSAVDDFMRPDRIVIGSDSSQVRELMVELYAPFMRNENPILFMDPLSAEVTKYAANAYLATRISFINEVANYCESVGADVTKVRRGMGSDSRIGMQFLYPGIGYGGSCFPKDVRALLKSGREGGYSFQIVEAVEKVNLSQKERLLSKLDLCFPEGMQDKVIALWGLAFKAKTDDMREAPSQVIIKGLLERGAVIRAFDPQANNQAQSIFGDKITLYENNYLTLEGAEALIIATEWNAFRRPDFSRMREMMNRPLILDGRNLYQPERLAAHGFTYISMGRPVLSPEGDSD